MKNIILQLILATICLNLFGQTRTITGKVIGDGESLPGVNVIEKGTTNGTVTDINGDFTLEIPDNKTVTLLFSFISLPVERVVKKNETYIKLKIGSFVKDRRFYSLLGATLTSKTKGNPSKHFFGTISLGYHYHYSRFGIGVEASLLPHKGIVYNRTEYQLGLPIYGSVLLQNRLKAIIGAGYFWAIDKDASNNDFKILAGLIYKKKRFAFDLRYYTGTVITLDNSSLQQNVTAGLRFYIM
ncbi:carboxypeptidase-like regulatory domain-containing protein [Fulvivirga sp.]|uniref:carboxypeptidase-like regulatory domain-containing protein n=1 Tax=Fulvivirga sp. TaxID=1931237 RepID=UPI0032F03739